jgi:hypothetical protein
MESGGREARDRRLQTVSEMGLAGPMETPTQVSQDMEMVMETVMETDMET